MRISDWSSDVCSSDRVGGRFPAVLPAMGRRIEADRIILCAGTESVRLARALGVRLPVLPMKGYSITAPPGDAAPRVSITDAGGRVVFARLGERRSEAHTSELQSIMRNSYAVFC